MGDVLKKFGRYLLLDHIAQGGMAEIYRARPVSLEGAGRLAVIKRIQAGYGTNNEFIQMFRSEIKVTMGFSHPNIVQLYDFGEEQGQPYIAMEYVDGKNVRQFIQKFAETRRLFPVDLATFIVEQSAAGLHYAHAFKDKITGKPLAIVHRDISPQNLLIAYEGSIKIIDFGIAKATTNVEATRAGVIKGKPSYLSPEQITGESLDGRSDIFALGAVMWEMLTGKKLFAGDNDLAVLKMIESCQTHVKPPSTLNPNVPKELDAIVMKALAKQRSLRYQTAEELQRALHRFLYSFNPDFNPSDLAYFAKELFQADIVEDRKKLQHLNARAEQILMVVERPSPASFSNHPVELDEEESTVVGVKAVPAQHAPVAPVENSLSAAATNAPRGKIEVEKVPGFWDRSSPSISAPEPSRGGDSLSRAPALGQLSNQSRAGVFKKMAFLAAACVAVVAVFSSDFSSKLPGYLGLGKKTPARTTASISPEQTQSVASPAANPELGVRMTMLKISVQPVGGNPVVTVNGNAVDPNTMSIAVPFDSPLEVMVDRKLFRPLKREFVLDSATYAGVKEHAMEVVLEPVRYGFLTISTTPSADAVIMFEGKPWIKKTPMEHEKFPVGTYDVKLRNDVLGMEKNITVTVQEGRTVQISEHLQLQ